MKWINTSRGMQFFRDVQKERVRRRREKLRLKAEERRRYWRALAGIGAPPNPRFTEGIDKPRRGSS